MEPERLERQIIEKAFVCGFKHERCNYARLMGLNPTGRTDAPLVARFEPREPELGVRSAEVVSDLFLKLEEFRRDPYAGGVFAGILAVGFTTPVPEEPGHGIARAGSKGCSEDILLERHGPILPVSVSRFKKRKRIPRSIDSATQGVLESTGLW